MSFNITIVKHPELQYHSLVILIDFVGLWKNQSQGACDLLKLIFVDGDSFFLVSLSAFLGREDKREWDVSVERVLKGIWEGVLKVARV